MKEQLISFDTAKLAYDKGFNNMYMGYHTYMYDIMGEISSEKLGYQNVQPNEFNKGFILAPTQSLLHKWLRELHNIDVVIAPERYKDGVNYLVQAQKFDLTSDPETNLNFCTEGSYWFNDNHDYPTYEDAMEKGLQEALKLIK